MTFGQAMCELMTERGISLRKLAKAVPCDAAAALSSARALYPAEALAPRANLDLMEAMAQIHDRDIDAGLQQALGTLQSHTRGSSGGRLLTSSILTALPDSARALPAARELHTLSAAPAQQARLV